MSATNSTTTHTAHCGPGACPICDEIERGNLIIVDNATSVPLLLIDDRIGCLVATLVQAATNIECSQLYDPNQESEFEKWNRLKSQKNFRKMMKKGKL